MMGQSYLPQVMNDLSAHLRYTGSWRRSWTAPNVDPVRRVCVGYNQCCGSSKAIQGTAVQDVIGSNGSDKRFHAHGQSASDFIEAVKRLSDEGSTVLDPFVGGGSVAAAALLLGRKFIGIDVRGSTSRSHEEGTRKWQKVWRRSDTQ